LSTITPRAGQLRALKGLVACAPRRLGCGCIAGGQGSTPIGGGGGRRRQACNGAAGMLRAASSFLRCRSLCSLDRLCMCSIVSSCVPDPANNVKSSCCRVLAACSRASAKLSLAWCSSPRAATLCSMARFQLRQRFTLRFFEPFPTKLRQRKTMNDSQPGFIQGKRPTPAGIEMRRLTDTRPTCVCH
jgi:hypothetical protein